MSDLQNAIDKWDNSRFIDLNLPDIEPLAEAARLVADPTTVTFVDWGDGFFVYFDGKYQGKDDQLVMEDILEHVNGKLVNYTVFDMPDDWDYLPPAAFTGNY